MTTQQRRQLDRIHETMIEQCRFQLDQARREQSRQVLLANALERAGELALDCRFQESRRVLHGRRALLCVAAV